MNERDALVLIRRLLTEALEQPSPWKYIRDLADQNGALRATMRAAVTVIDQTEAEK
ncbi:hypothetical protein OG252_33315 [Streptomyces sp. NBC_01352]|uniref:hypothetical protein n=1 Tax=Streptomyces sp. NBC_01352 TaxID=2903834 RepID=UPI002E2EC87D|nr:hypothetical protein [Streptomyces sp. NBC_01352]